jgi:hypothetical protein
MALGNSPLDRRKGNDMDTFRTVVRLGRKLVLATTCVLGLSGGGEAAELFTPFLLISPGNSFMSCLVSNVSRHDTTVRIEAFSLSGDSLGDTEEIVLPAGETGFIHVARDHARCKFTVRTKNDVRAHGTVFQTGVGSTSSAEAK